MKLIEPVAGAVILDGGGTVSKSELINQLLRHLASTGHIPATDVPALRDAVLQREALASTGIGQGIAVPHTRHSSITRTLVLFAVCRSPVHFDSIDAEPTDLFVLCLAPRDPWPADQFKASPWSQVLMRHLTNKTFCDHLRQAPSNEELWERLVRADNERPWD